MTWKKVLYTIIYFGSVLFLMTKLDLGAAVVSAFFFSALYWMVLQFNKEMEDEKWLKYTVSI